MALTKLEENLNTIENLPDSPTLETAELKKKFDESSIKIKEYINEVLTDELDKLFNKKLDKTGGTITGNLAVQNLTGKINGFTWDVNTNNENDTWVLVLSEGKIKHRVLNTAFNSDIKTVGKLMYPVGSIYLSVKNTNPSYFFGGTWVAWGTGRVPVGVNASDNDFKTVEKTGGEKTHKLTTAEMPSHNHDFGNPRKFAMVDTGQMDYGWGTHFENSTGYRSTASNMNNTGGNGAHNNLQPYITCYMWKRTS